MDQYAFLLGYFDKQLTLAKRLYGEIVNIDLTSYDKRFVFALKTQQFYTALEDLFKQIAKSFENHIDNLSSFHRELLMRMNIEVPKTRPAVLSTQSLLFLDKLRSFCHFIGHAYDCELEQEELIRIQNKLKAEFAALDCDLNQFRTFIQELTECNSESYR